ncbi:MAG: DUF2807 domain-containing protein [Prevotella sp.]|nr:DUF2807 domain-containing protein [Prevotella sp.]
MKQKSMILIALAALVVLVGSCHWEVERNFKKTKGPKVVKTYQNIRPFERIRIDDSCICEIHFSQGDSTKIEVGSADPKALNLIDVKSNGEWLQISQKRQRKWNIFPIIISITSPDLIEVNMHGSASFYVNDEFDTDILQLALKGIGKINFQDIICDRIEAHLEGTGKMNFDQLQTQQAELSLKGVGKINAHFVKSGSVNCSLKGVGDIDLSGEVRSLQKRKQGTGKIDVSNLKINN